LFLGYPHRKDCATLASSPIEDVDIRPAVVHSPLAWPHGRIIQKGVSEEPGFPLENQAPFSHGLLYPKGVPLGHPQQVGLALALAIAPPSTDSTRRWYEPTPVSRREGLGPRTPGCGPAGRKFESCRAHQNSSKRRVVNESLLSAVS